MAGVEAEGRTVLWRQRVKLPWGVVRAAPPSHVTAHFLATQSLSGPVPLCGSPFSIQTC